jgi:hypothetical protein
VILGIVDLNNDVIDTDDRTELGDPIPDFTFGVTVLQL